MFYSAAHLKSENYCEQVTVRAQLVIEVEKHKGGGGLAAQERTVVAQCGVEGRVGHTQLLVSHNTVTLLPSEPQLIGLKNAGAVPLGLSVVPFTEAGVRREQHAIQVEPAQLLLLPGEQRALYLQWNAHPQSAADFNWCEQNHEFFSGMPFKNHLNPFV
jgi:hypothetical protein